MRLAIVVSDYKDTNFWKQFTTYVGGCDAAMKLFQTTKIQTFESNSQPILNEYAKRSRCFRLQRYKLLKAIHNNKSDYEDEKVVVSDYKDTNFWKQFTTIQSSCKNTKKLFQTTKIQTFESNSQPWRFGITVAPRCFRLQRYKLLKAIHNLRRI